MNHLKGTFTVSERREARIVGVSRSTPRYHLRTPADEPRLLARMEALVRKHPGYRYGHIWALLRREG